MDHSYTFLKISNFRGFLRFPDFLVNTAYTAENWYRKKKTRYRAFRENCVHVLIHNRQIFVLLHFLWTQEKLKSLNLSIKSLYCYCYTFPVNNFWHSIYKAFFWQKGFRKGKFQPIDYSDILIIEWKTLIDAIFIHYKWVIFCSCIFLHCKEAKLNVKDRHYLYYSS